MSRRPGQALVFIVVSIVALMGMVALVVDLGLLFVSHREAQRAADSAALAAASAFLGNPTVPQNAIPLAKALAKQYGAQNFINNEFIDTTFVSGNTFRDSTAELVVDVNPGLRQVYVRVHRQNIPLWFAKLIGFDLGGVAASATAEAAETGTATCLKPFAIPDVGYSTWTIGQIDTLKAADPNAPGGSAVDNYFFPFEIAPDPSTSPYCPNMNNPHADPFSPIGRNGSPVVVGPPTYPTGSCGTNAQCWYQANICNQNCSEVSVGPTYNVVNGDMDGPTAFGTNVLIAQDPEAWFNTADNKLYRGSTPIQYTESSRTIKVALYNPATVTHPSQTTITFTGIALFFLEYGPYTQTGWQTGPWHYPYQLLPAGFGLYDTQNQAPIVGRFLAFAPGVGGSNTSTFALYLRLIR